MKYNSLLRLFALLIFCGASEFSYARSFIIGAINKHNPSSPMEGILCDTEHRAFQGNIPNLPGVVEAENYNEGCPGIPFFDTNAINEGGVYRNDAVDIEECSEGGYNLGWTQSSEWLNYQVNVQNTGNHDFSFRVAAMNAGGQFHLELNGQNITGNIDIPSTGAWQNWVDVAVSGVQLTAGIQHLKLVITGGGFNLNNFSAVYAPIVSAPEITQIVATPSSPLINETIEIQATITDDGTVTTAEINWGYSSDNLLNIVQLSSNNSNSYTGTIPAQIEEGIIYYQITATDNSGLIATSPVNSVTVQSVNENQPTLVWSDEFNYTGLPDPSKWGYDTGNGGFGNNELQNYTASRLENARVENGSLIIEARRDWHEGIEYSSARMVTRNKGDWLYGRIEVKAKLPGAGRGTWPAIWMLPTDWEYGGWPNSGEIDIMENVGYDPNVVHGTVHTEAYNHILGTQLAGKVEKSNYHSEFHIYAVNWYEDKIDFFIDDELYFTHHKHGGSAEWPFDKRFHLILNIAVGGNWGGAQGVDSSIWPKQMEVDYVRVYGQPATPDPETVDLPGTIEAENYAQSSGVQTETCEEGGLNVGHIDAGDWFKYNVNVTQSGLYTVEYRVASNEADGAFNLEQDKGNTILGTLNVPNTGGWQNWQTISHEVTLNSGEQQLAIGVPSGGFNMNWIRFTPKGTPPVEVDPIQIEAESYKLMEGIQVEACSEGGQNIGWTTKDDWLVYDADIPAGNYTLEYRIASQNGGGELQIEKAGGGNSFGTIMIPSTSGWQNWRTVSHDIQITENLNEIAINIRNGGFNLNWFSLTPKIVNNGRQKTLAQSLQIYPNPAHNVLNIKGVGEVVDFQLFGIDGRSYNLKPQNAQLDISTLNQGIYFMKITDHSNSIHSIKFIKE
ncbi:carbohydrate-binding protein [Flammeovirga aprica]|uniref:Carbohydrate-binding protein n=1 Tax=Flammeovirga aprica JL-4 TaxID=694437 RepID=A0A7X9P2C7_9BACT|nr:carbohydrate-binding protein [Flammeovirga aprica]NME67137.1 carbohydrate-binding protein [Flammeovirga aprica JL-4]